MISEYPPNTKCQSQYFLERNRIISGLSLGVLVIEAIFRSGTSVTAKLAILQNKKVFALPHEIWNIHGVGTNFLLKNGAILVTSVEDILQEFKNLKEISKKYREIQKINLSEFNSKCKLFQNYSNCITYSSALEVDTNNYLDSSRHPYFSSHNHYTNDVNIPNPLKKKTLKNARFKDIYELISTEAISINEICKKTSKSISEVSNALFILELEGYAKKVAGGYICILNK